MDKEYTIERLKNTVCKYEFCKCVLHYQMAMIDVDKKLWDNLWEELNGIDEDLIPVLTELNEKGYYTNSCCSGHLEGIEKHKSWQIYLSFEDDYDLKDIPLKKNKKGCIYSLEYDGKKKSVEEINEERLKVIEKLLEWAKGLPKCEIENSYKIKNGWVMYDDNKLYKIDWEID